MSPFMPLTKVHLRHGSTPEKRRAIADAVHKSLVDILGIPEQDRFLVIVEYTADNFVHTPSFDLYELSYTDDLLMIEISFIEGRSDDVKKTLISELNARLTAAARVRTDDVVVVLYEVGRANVSFGQGLTQRASSRHIRERRPAAKGAVVQAGGAGGGSAYD
jgi:phenylpyruvate tautomerase PptA (4-oxalocrotonate tautomerase family)